MRDGSRRRLVSVLAASLAAGFVMSVSSALAAPPSGFLMTEVAPGWSEVAGVVPLEDGRALAWERGGRVWMLTAEGERIQPPILDLHEEVGGWRDHGLLGVAPHPNFLANGQIFLLYVVDRHHLLYAGTPQYDSNADEYYAASIGRVTRYTLDAATEFTTAVPGSRTVLLGESKTTGIPVVHQSHGVGTLLFGEDGTLLVSIGDNASYESVDLGGQVSGGYVSQALADGILKPKENVGSFRSQLVDCLCGKVLRLDPDTGDGVPSNPFFDAADPRAPRSRVWCLGLRNPFRMSIEHETGSHDPADGDPGTLLIGDVGWTLIEELNRAETGGLNFGWPVFEGLTYHDAYGAANIKNLDAPNPLGGAGCNEDFFYFKSLIRQDSLVANPILLNPCAVRPAEGGATSGASVATASLGYTGTGYLTFNGPAGSWAQWSIDVPQSGSWVVAVRHSNAIGNKSYSLLVDGRVAAANVVANATGSSTEWRVVETTLQLTQGTHTLRLATNSSAGLNVDGFALYAPGDAPTLGEVASPFMHARPIADWHHATGTARVPTFISGGASVSVIGGITSIVLGQGFGGQCAIGGPRIHFKSWPEEWHDRVLFGDFSSLWIRAFRLTPLGKVAEVSVFDPNFGNVVSLVANEATESLYAIRWPGELWRIDYAPGGNQPPVIAVSTSQPWGPSPLAVTFDASASSDPEGTPLSFAWDFGDGTTGTGPSVEHVFTARSPAPQAYFVKLTVTDVDGASKTKTITVSANNTPPSVTIRSVYDGQLYPMDAKTFYPLLANVTDAEHAGDQLSCEWQLTLHHNTHEHPEPTDPNCESEAVITPLGCGLETYWYDVELRVTDAAGLTTIATAELFPDCAGVLACNGDLDHDGDVDSADLGVLLGLWGTPATWSDFDGTGDVGAGDLGILLGNWGPCQ
ncbi:MAG: PQQ-dependent sugar dehydrogenase [Phycisphaerae bacterium]|nr:PQQ-dependent sugar dehydrogenase [Phycisphaerae bacterium]